MMTRWIYRSLSIAILAMLSFSQAYAFESPSGYQQAVYAVDWSFTEPIVSACATPEPVAQNTAENLTVCNACNMPYKSYNSGGYITYNFLESVTTLASNKPQRGYTKVLFS